MSSELVAVELQLKGYEGVMSDMRALDQMLNGFRGKKNRIEIESNLAKTKQELLALKGAMTEFKEQQAQVAKGGTAWNILQGYIEETSAKMKDCRQRANELQYALKNFSQMSWYQVFSKISSGVAHFGSAMQSAGNALTRLTSPFQRFTSGMVMGAGYQALGKFTEGLSSAFSRADTMRKYPRIMEAMGYSASEAQASIDKLDKAVQGLPTKLDDIVGMSQRFTSTIGDMNKGTDLAIAANNAFLASMSTETQKYQGMMQLQDVIGGKKMNAKEWQALANSMMPAIRMMGESLGLEGEELDKYVAKIQQGKMANEEFLDTLLKAGTDENGKIRQIAMESLDTWEAFFARIGTAASRLGYKGIIEPLNEMVDTVTGGKFKSVNLLLDDFVIHGIDNMTASIRKWVKSHPEEITEFFKSLKGINWGSIIKGFGQGLLGMANFIKRISDVFGGKDLSLIGKFMVYGNLLGNFLTIGGGLLKGSRHPIGGVVATVFDLVKSVKGIRKYGLMGWLGRSLTVGEDAVEGKKAIDTATKSASNMGKFSTGLSKIFTGWSQIATMIGGSAFVAWGSMKLIKNAIKDFKKTVDVLNTVDWDMGKKALIGIGGFLGGMAALSGIAGHFASASGTMLLGELVVGLFSTLALGFADIDMKLFRGTMKSLADATSYFDPIAKNIEAFKGFALDKNAKQTIRDAVKNINAITRIFTGEVDTDTHQRKGGLKNFSKKHAESLENIKKSAQLLNQISAIEINNKKLSTSTEGITEALKSIDSMITNIPSGLGDKGTVGTTGNLASIVGNLKTAFGDLIGKGGILNQIPKIVEKIGNMTVDPENNALDKFKIQMTKLGDAMAEAYKGLAGKLRGSGDLMQRVTNFADAVYQTRRVIYHLGKLNAESASVDVGGGVGVIETTVANLKKAFGSKKVGELKQQIETFVTSVKDALKTIEDIGTEPIEIDAEVKLSDDFNSSVNKCVKEIGKARSKILKAWAGIPTSLSKTVTFHIAINAVVSGIQASINKAWEGFRKVRDSLPVSTGGQITVHGTVYRAGGGSIFKPRGTDIVPAMLTPGEYVHKKQAVDFFGVDFMRSINNMDVRGAMESLLTKAGTSIGVGRQSIVNNTVNNNQRITQHINTNNPNFAKARMGRFVGAL